MYLNSAERNKAFDSKVALHQNCDVIITLMISLNSVFNTLKRNSSQMWRWIQLQLQKNFGLIDEHQYSIVFLLSTGTNQKG